LISKSFGYNILGTYFHKILKTSNLPNLDKGRGRGGFHLFRRGIWSQKSSDVFGRHKSDVDVLVSAYPNRKGAYLPGGTRLTRQNIQPEPSIVHHRTELAKSSGGV
jgi:hypothetical protein